MLISHKNHGNNRHKDPDKTAGVADENGLGYRREMREGIFWQERKGDTCEQSDMQDAENKHLRPASGRVFGKTPE